MQATNWQVTDWKAPLGASAKRLAMLCGLLLVGLPSAKLWAQDVYMEHERYGTWEVAFHYNRVGSQRIAGLLDGELQAEQGVALGATFGYNFNNQLSLGLAMMSGEQDYMRQGQGGHELDFNTTQLQATWHFLPGELTPYVMVGAGWSTLDSNIASRQRPSQDCWWDPWWGYSCTSYYPTFTDTKTSLSANLGVRWDFHRQFFTRVSYGRQWTDDDSSSPSMVRFEIGIRR